MTRRRLAAQFVLLVVALSVVAMLSPEPWFETDRPVYEAIGQRFFMVDCSDLHCFRLLASWLVGRFPGDAEFRWKAFAVLSTAGAALATARLCLVLGMTSRAAQFAIWLVALGFGPLLTLFNPYTPDPLMYFLGPLMTAELFVGRRGRAMVAGTIGVFAKEVAAAPLWIFWLLAVFRRQWDLARRMFAMAFGATLVWVWLQLFLMIAFNNTYAGSQSADLLHGGDFVGWIDEMSAIGAAVAVLGAFGAVYLLMPFGFARASREYQLFAAATVPAALVLCYVQQPERALWNFHYAIIPLAVLALQRLPNVLCWLFIASYGLANLRVGAQLAFLPSARYGLAVSFVIAVAAAVATLRRSDPHMTLTPGELPA
jgi:hypothetical protein